MLLPLLLSSLSIETFGCAPTQPIGPAPSSNCCPINIYDSSSTGMAVFDPTLRDCPTTALMICSVRVVGNTNPVIISINGGTQVAVGPMGTNVRATMICRISDRTWLMIVNGIQTAVSSISCNNS